MTTQMPMGGWIPERSESAELCRVAQREGTRALLLTAPTGATASALERFQRTVGALVSVTSPHVSGVIDFDLVSDRPFVALELPTGPTLAEAMASGQPVALPEQLAAALGHGLSALHAAGLSDGHLTPDKIVLTSDGPVLQAHEFAAAESVSPGDEATRLPPSSLSGFEPPELATGGVRHGLGDLFGWGALVRFAATGEPVLSVSGAAGQARHAAESASNTPGVQGELGALVRRALDPAPQRRPTVDELRTKWEPPETRGGRPQRVLALAAIAALAAVGAVLWVVLGNGSEGTGSEGVETSQEVATEAEPVAQAPSVEPEVGEDGLPPSLREIAQGTLGLTTSLDEASVLATSLPPIVMPSGSVVTDLWSNSNQTGIRFLTPLSTTEVLTELDLALDDAGYAATGGPTTSVTSSTSSVDVRYEESGIDGSNLQVTVEEDSGGTREVTVAATWRSDATVQPHVELARSVLPDADVGFHTFRVDESEIEVFAVLGTAPADIAALAYLNELSTQLGVDWSAVGEARAPEDNEAVLDLSRAGDQPGDTWTLDVSGLGSVRLTGLLTVEAGLIEPPDPAPLELTGAGASLSAPGADTVYPIPLEPQLRVPVPLSADDSPADAFEAVRASFGASNISEHIEVLFPNRNEAVPIPSDAIIVGVELPSTLMIAVEGSIDDVASDIEVSMFQAGFGDPSVEVRWGDEFSERSFRFGLASDVKITIRAEKGVLTVRYEGFGLPTELTESQPPVALAATWANEWLNAKGVFDGATRGFIGLDVFDEVAPGGPSAAASVTFFWPGRSALGGGADEMFAMAAAASPDAVVREPNVTTGEMALVETGPLGKIEFSVTETFFGESWQTRATVIATEAAG